MATYLVTGTNATLTSSSTSSPEQRPSGGWEWLNNLNPPSRRYEPAEEARLRRLRLIALSDDEWLMME